MNKKLKLDELNRLSVAEFKSAEKFPVTVVLDDVRSMYNVGSIFRTCDALAVEQLFLCGITPKPPHREIEKTALGATMSVDWQYESNILELQNRLKSENKKIYAIEQAEESLMLNKMAFHKNEHYVLVFGNEVSGVKQEIVDLADACIEIPQFGTKHSFNVSNSVGIVVWGIVRGMI